MWPPWCSGSPVEVSLLHVLPMASEELLWQISLDENFKSKIKEQYERFNDECQRAAQKFLDEAKEILVNSRLCPGLYHDHAAAVAIRDRQGHHGRGGERVMMPWSLAGGGWGGSKA